VKSSANIPADPPPGQDREPSESGDSLLKAVTQWDEEMRLFIRFLVQQLKEGESLPVERLFLAEQSIELLLTEKFRKRYAQLLKEYPDAATRFRASDPATGRRFIQELGVVEIIPPAKSPNPPGMVPAAMFPYPTVLHRGRGERRIGEPPDNIRLVLDHIDLLGSHPVYLLVCTLCGWPQGALGRAESYASDLPYPTDQVAQWYLSTWKERRGEDKDLERLVDALRQDFGEEIWGLRVGGIKSPRMHSSWRHPVSGKIGELLDRLLWSHREYPEGYPEVLVEDDMAWERRRIEALALILSQIACQVCARKGGARYMPRYLMPLDADLSAKFQSSVAAHLSGLLDSARDRLASEFPTSSEVLWIPERFPRIRLSELCQRFELRHEARTEEAKREANLWLVAMWLIDLSSATARRSRRAETKPGDTRMTWWALTEELGLSRGDPVEQEMNRLRTKVDRLVGSKKVHHHQIIHRVQTLLEGSDFDKAVPMLARYYSDEILQKKIDELRR
jgi:hypothetical protein